MKGLVEKNVGLVGAKENLKEIIFWNFTNLCKTNLSFLQIQKKYKEFIDRWLYNNVIDS